MKHTREIIANFKVSRSYLALTSHQAPDGRTYEMGHAVTPDGIVAVYTEASCTVLRFVHDFREWRMTITPGLSSRGIVTEARRFADRAVCGELPDGGRE